MDLDKAMTTARGRHLVIMAVALVALVMAWAIAHAGSLSGPAIHTNADVNCPNGSATTAMAASTPLPAGNPGPTNRLCVEVDWVSGSPARVGDASISASQGIPMAAATGTSKTVCSDSALLCWGIGGASVLAVTELGRQ